MKIGQSSGYWPCWGRHFDPYFGFAPVSVLVSEPGVRKAARIFDKNDSRSVTASGLEALGPLSGPAEGLDESARGGVAGLDGALPLGALPGDGDPGGAPPVGDALSSVAAGEGLDVGDEPPVSLGAAGGDAGGASTLPRMIGRPSRPVPITTTFAFVDCASCSVASMPRQRR